MDIKMELAVAVAKEYCCTVLRERCPDCGTPLVKFPGQNVALCILRIIKNEYAQQDRALLERLVKLDALSQPMPEIDANKILNDRARSDWHTYLNRRIA